MPFRFISGPDDFLVQRTAQDEWKAMAREIDDPNSLEEIDGQAGNLDEVEQAVTRFISAVQTVSMFSPEKAVWLKQVTFLADSVTGRAKGTMEAVERLQEFLGGFDDPAVRILISASPVDRRKKAYKWFHKTGKSTFLEAGKDDEAVRQMIEAEAKGAGKSFTGNAASILIELVAGNTRLALEETRKLITYLADGDASITPRLVAELVPSVGESNFFEAAEAFYSLDLIHTQAAIHRHFFAGHDARPLITSLQNRNRILIQLKSLQMGGAIRGRPGKQAFEQAACDFADSFGDPQRKSSFCIFSQNPWYVGRLAEGIEKLPLKALLEFQEAFREAFLEIISRPQEQEAVMQAVAVRCLSPLQ